MVVNFGMPHRQRPKSPNRNRTKFGLASSAPDSSSGPAFRLCQQWHDHDGKGGNDDAGYAPLRNFAADQGGAGFVQDVNSKPHDGNWYRTTESPYPIAHVPFGIRCLPRLRLVWIRWKALGYARRQGLLCLLMKRVYYRLNNWNRARKRIHAHVRNIHVLQYFDQSDLFRSDDTG